MESAQLPYIHIARSPNTLIKLYSRPKLDLIFCSCVRISQVVYVLRGVILTKGIISPKKNIFYCFCNFPSRLYFKNISSSLEPSYVVWWSSLIYHRCMFDHLLLKICYLFPCYPKNDCNQNLYGKQTHLYGYLLYPKCHQGQSQYGVILGQMSIAWEGGNNHTFGLGCLHKINSNIGYKYCGKTMSGRSDVLI